MVKVHGFVVAAVLGLDLGVEAGHLVFGIVQLRETIAKLAPGDVQLKTLGHFRALIVGARQWADFGGVLHDEGGVPQLLFHHLFKVQHLQARQAARGQLVFVLVHAQLAQGVGQPVAVGHVLAGIGVFHDGLRNAQALKRRGQVHRLAGIGAVQGAHGLHGRIADELLGKVHQIAVIPPRRVELHHRELGVVAHADAFVAEVAVDLEYPLKTAHHQALQVQLRGNAQIHLLVQRIVVRDKRLGIGPTGDGVQHGRFDL